MSEYQGQTEFERSALQRLGRQIGGLERPVDVVADSLGELLGAMRPPVADEIRQGLERRLSATDTPYVADLSRASVAQRPPR